MDASDSSARRERLLDALLGLVVTLVVLGPVILRRGYVLVGDMVFVPRQGWKDAWIAADGAVPRAVPGDALVSLFSQVVGGEVLQGVALGGALLLAWIGMTRLLADLPRAARWAGALCFVWSPYVHERLEIGHWALLCGYAALPWAAGAVLRLRRPAEGGRLLQDPPRARAWGTLVVALALAGWLSPTGGVLAVLVALCLAIPSWSLMARVLGVSLALNLPWIVPAFGNGADQLAPDAFGVTAFASRADTPWGVLGSVLSFGGIWKESIFPALRAEPLFSAVGLLVALLGLAGVVMARRRRVLPMAGALTLAAVSLVLALWGSWDFSRPGLEWVVENVPGGGLLRDTQKWVAGWSLVASVGFASAGAAVLDVARRRGVVGVAVAWVLLPVLSLPTLAFALGGALSSDPYPREWDQVRQVMEEQVRDDLVVVLPFATYRRFDWTPRTTLDPAPRYFPGTLVTEDALTVPEGTVGGESALAARIRGAGSPEELAQVLSEEGVRWALVHLSTEDVMLPAGAEVVLDGRQLDLLRLPEPLGAPAWEPGARPWLYGSLDVLVLAASSIVVIRLFTCRNSSHSGPVSAYTPRS